MMACALRLRFAAASGRVVGFRLVVYPAFVPQHAGACHRETCRAIISRPAARDWMMEMLVASGRVVGNFHFVRLAARSCPLPAQPVRSRGRLRSNTFVRGGIRKLLCTSWEEESEV
jgi:hypothetical protein